MACVYVYVYILINCSLTTQATEHAWSSRQHELYIMWHGASCCVGFEASQASRIYTYIYIYIYIYIHIYMIQARGQ